MNIIFFALLRPCAATHCAWLRRDETRLCLFLRLPAHDSLYWGSDVGALMIPFAPPMPLLIIEEGIKYFGSSLLY